MRRRVGTTVGAIGCVAAAAVFACSTFSSDNEPAPPPQPGERLGACLSDGKCNPGLECRLPERICLTPGEPLPPNVDASVLDGGGLPDVAPSDASKDNAQPDATAGSCNLTSGNPPGPRCSSMQCAPDEICCVTGGSAQCLIKSSCQGPEIYACDNGGCAPGNTCCLGAVGNLGDGGACGRTITAAQSVCVSVCQTAEHTFCKNDTECLTDSGKNNCQPVEVTTGGPFKPIWKICMP